MGHHHQSATAVNPSGVISASGFGALPGASPGSWIEIYGSNAQHDTRLGH